MSEWVHSDCPRNRCHLYVDLKEHEGAVTARRSGPLRAAPSFSTSWTAYVIAENSNWELGISSFPFQMEHSNLPPSPQEDKLKCYYCDE